LRIDREVTSAISIDLENQLLEQVKLVLAEGKPDIVIFEDYDKVYSQSASYKKSRI
jgi:hypothetical protein